jgi:hypothetical protein
MFARRIMAVASPEGTDCRRGLRLGLPEHDRLSYGAAHGLSCVMLIDPPS